LNKASGEIVLSSERKNQ